MLIQVGRALGFSDCEIFPTTMLFTLLLCVFTANIISHPGSSEDKIVSRAGGRRDQIFVRAGDSEVMI